MYSFQFEFSVGSTVFDEISNKYVEIIGICYCNGCLPNLSTKNLESYFHDIVYIVKIDDGWDTRYEEDLRKIDKNFYWG